ncbi:MAG: 4Fe-4S binding protein [Candidatus Aenigmatarchaeota archaeon]
MPVLINFKICDNSKDCSGIEVCPTGALSWDDAKKTIDIDNSKCITCGKCEPACPVGAIKVAKDQEEYNRIKKEIDEDPRKVSDLFVDRYGAQPVHHAFLIPQDKFEVQILEATQLAALELFKDETIMCLLHSIPIKQLFEGMEVKYRKMEVENDALLERYGVRELPALLFFKDGNLLGKIEGFFDVKKRRELTDRINKIVSG